MLNPQKVVFVGLGTMGVPIAKHISSSQPLIGVDLSAKSRAIGEAQGIETTENLSSVLSEASHVCLMLPTVSASRSVIDLVVHGADNPLTVIEFGTVGLDATTEHAVLVEDAGHQYVDAPVIGGGLPAAKQKSLIALVGGSQKAVEQATPVLTAMSREQVLLGPAGAGQMMKLIHNSLLAAITVVSAEALAMASKLGLDEDKTFELLSASSTNSFAMDWFFGNAAKRRDSNGVKLSLVGKDLDLAKRLWESSEVDMSATQAASQTYRKSLSDGLGEDEINSILPYLGGSYP